MQTIFKCRQILLNPLVLLEMVAHIQTVYTRFFFPFLAWPGYEAKCLGFYRGYNICAVCYSTKLHFSAWERS